MSFQDPDQREEWAKRSAMEKAKAVRELELASQRAAVEPVRKSELDYLVEEARRHNLQLASASWDGERWHATFSRTGS